MTRFAFTVAGMLDIDEDVLGIAMANLVGGDLSDPGVADAGMTMRLDPDFALRAFLMNAVLDRATQVFSGGGYEFKAIEASTSVVEDGREG